MLIARTQAHLLQELDKLRACGHPQPRIALVTLKGPCHDGHSAVINAARTMADRVVVALTEERDPQQTNVVSAGEFHDLSFIEHHHPDLLYAPDTNLWHAAGFSKACQVHLPTATDPEGNFSFALTAQLKLLNLIRPETLVIGEKHWERAFYTRKMIADLGVHCTVQSVPTVRHADGTAVSTLYETLTDHQRDQAALLYETLNNTAHAIRNGARNYAKVENTARLALREGGLHTRRYTIVDEHTYQPADTTTNHFRILAEVELDDLLLRDNLGLFL